MPSYVQMMRSKPKRTLAGRRPGRALLAETVQEPGGALPPPPAAGPRLNLAGNVGPAPGGAPAGAQRGLNLAGNWAPGLLMLPPPPPVAATGRPGTPPLSQPTPSPAAGAQAGGGSVTPPFNRWDQIAGAGVAGPEPFNRWQQIAGAGIAAPEGEGFSGIHWDRGAEAAPEAAGPGRTALAQTEMGGLTPREVYRRREPMYETSPLHGTMLSPQEYRLMRRQSMGNVRAAEGRRQAMRTPDEMLADLEAQNRLVTRRRELGAQEFKQRGGIVGETFEEAMARRKRRLAVGA